MYVVVDFWQNGYMKITNNGNKVTDFRHCTKFKTKLGAILFVLGCSGKHYLKIEKYKEE